MRDFVGSNSAQPAPATSPSGDPKSRMPIAFLIAALAAVLILSFDAVVAGANSLHAAGISYLTFSFVQFGCAAVFWIRARSAQGTLRLRWHLIAAAALAAGIGYIPSVTECLLNTGSQRQLQTICFGTGEALYVLATVLFFADVARSIVLVDILQTFLFIALRFNLIYSAATRDHFALNHLLVGQFVALFLFLVASVACLGAASRAELHFLRILSCFFGLRLIGFFLSNQVGYTWLHYTYCSRLDVIGPALLSALALTMLYRRYANSETSIAAPVNPPSLLVRSLMPSFLALVNLMLGLFLLQISVRLAAVAIVLSVICYVARTVMLQAQVLQDKVLLETHNKQLEDLAVRDPLTGIGNRRSLARAYNHLCTVDGGKSLSLLLMDIDCFKQANDCHGHLHGDRILMLLAKQLESLTTGIPGSHCARLGGDEFTLLLPEIPPQAAITLADNLRLLFCKHANLEVNSAMSLSIGVASLHAAHDLPLESLASRADEALYRAKLLGRNRVEAQPIWEPHSDIPGCPTPPLHPQLQQFVQ